MELRLTRDVFTDAYTLSTIDVDGKAFGYAVEDEDRGLASTDDAARITAVKVPMETAIPVGRYRVRTTFSNKYQRMMPLVVDVPGFRGIRIHSGNTEQDTAGCILPGTVRTVNGVAHSKPACEWLYAEIAKVEKAGGEVWITVGRKAGVPLAAKFR
jgi:hypothetical protein